MSGPKYAVLGLGEAGRTFASALASTATVVGWDPFVTTPIPGVHAAASAAAAAGAAGTVLSFTTAAHSQEALRNVLGAAAPGTVYADFATDTSDAKRELAHIAGEAGLHFVDAAIMAPVRRGAEDTPVLLAGDAAVSLARSLTADGLLVEVLEGPVGTAAARKLLRSMLVKGLTGVMIESLRAADHEGLLNWFSDHLVETLTALEPATLSGFLDGTRLHAVRRIDEMDAAASMAEAAGGTAEITRAVAAILRTVKTDGIPAGGRLA